MKLKSFLRITFISLLLTIAISPLRGYASFQVCSLIGFTVYFFFTLFCKHRYSKVLSRSLILVAILLGLCLLEAPIRILTFTASLVSFPDFILHFLGVIFGFLFANLKSPQKWLTTTIGFALTLFMFFDGYDLWLHKLNFGTFTGKVSYALPAKFEAFDQGKNLVTDQDFANKVVLLDFWTTSCGVCFRKFPQLQKFHEKHKDDAAMRILAVDTPLEDDKEGDAFAIKEQGHTFPVVITKEANLAEQFGVKGYPTTFVIDRQGKVVYRGDIAGATKLAEELLKTS